MSRKRNLLFRTLRFYVTHRCNSNCLYCNTHNSRYASIEEMPYEKGIALIDEAAKLGVNYIDFTGGEPILNEHLWKYVRHAKELGITSEVTTNGILGLTDNLQKCLEYADVINVSLDTLNFDTYKSIRGIDGFDRTKNTLDCISALPKNLKSKVKIICTVTNHNIKDVEAVLKYAGERYLLVYLNPVFSYADNSISEDTIKIFEFVRKYFFYPNTMVPLSWLELYGNDQIRSTYHCSACRKTLTSYANGDLVVPCYHSSHVQSIPWENSLLEAIENPYFQDCRKKIYITDACKSCMVSSYFVRTSEYWLDSISLLNSLSLDLVELKKICLKYQIDYEIDEIRCTKLIESYRQLISRLDSRPDEDMMLGESKFNAYELPDGRIATDIYREPLLKEDFDRENAKASCFDMELHPSYHVKELLHNLEKTLVDFDFNSDRKNCSKPDVEIEKIAELVEHIIEHYIAFSEATFKL